MTSRLAYRIAYSAMVFVLAAACTPGGETDGATAPATTEQAPIAPPNPEATGAAPNTADTLSTTPADPSAPAATPEELASGASTYARTCAMCHGAKGEGTPAGVALVSKDVAVIANKITKGQVNPGDKMPPMGAMMSPEEVTHVAKFIAAGYPAQ